METRDTVGKGVTEVGHSLAARRVTGRRSGPPRGAGTWELPLSVVAAGKLCTRGENTTAGQHGVPFPRRKEPQLKCMQGGHSSQDEGGKMVQSVDSMTLAGGTLS